MAKTLLMLAQLIDFFYSTALVLFYQLLRNAGGKGDFGHEISLTISFHPREMLREKLRDITSCCCPG